MHTGDALPRVGTQTKMPDVIYEMSRKKLGVTAVVERERLVGSSATATCAGCSKSAGRMCST